MNSRWPRDSAVSGAPTHTERVGEQNCRLSFVNIGRSAYADLAGNRSAADAALYAGLADAFVPLMDVLRATRSSDPAGVLDALEAAERWGETGSGFAWREAERLTGATLLSGGDQLH